MHWFIKTDGEGRVTRVFKTTLGTVEDNSHEGIHLASEGDRALLKRNKLDQVLFKEGKLEQKQELSFVLDKQTIKADGLDQAVLTLNHFPEGYETITVKIDKVLVNLKADDPIEITATKPGIIQISLKEPKLTAEKVRLYVEDKK